MKSDLRPALSHCLPGCNEKPSVVFCEEHWKHVPRGLQAELLIEMARLRPGTAMTSRLASLLKQASAEVELQLKGAGKVHDVGGRGAVIH